MNTIARTKKEWMKDQLDTMDASEHAQVLAIVRKYTEQCTKTQSGILISTDLLNDECLGEIEQYILFLADQKKRMDEDVRTRRTYERMVQ